MFNQTDGLVTASARAENNNTLEAAKEGVCGGFARFAAWVVAALCAATAGAQVNVTTWHNDIGRTGQNLSETALTTSNVNAMQFGKLFAQPVDGYVYAQPLYVAGLSINAGVHNVLFVATEHDSVYAFDADSNVGADANPLWQASMLSTAHGAAAGATTIPWPVNSDIVPEVGITGTPVIDPASGTLYVVSATLENNNQVQRLHALDVYTGAEKFGGPVKIVASVPGTAPDNVSGMVSFNAQQESQRPGLLLLNGIIYIGWSSHEDLNPFHGWIIGYNAQTLAQTGVFCATPNGGGGGIWMSGGGLAADQMDPVNHPYGRMFIATGNGEFSATKPYGSNMNYGDSHVNLDLTNGTPTVTDDFTTNTQATDNSQDIDVGSGGVLLVPTQTTGSHPHLLVQAGKPGTIYLLDRENLGGYNTTSDQAVQELASAVGGNANGVWSSPAYWNGNVYFWGQYDNLKSFALVNGLLSTTPTKSKEQYGFPGATPAVSANGNTQGIVWSIDSSNSTQAVLQAHDANNVATMLYSSATNSARDGAGPSVKFAVPTIVNGKVYVGTSREIDIYGLLGGQVAANLPVISPGSKSFTGSLVVTISDSTPNSSIYYTTDGSPASPSATLYTGSITVSTPETINAIAIAPGFTQSSQSSATYSFVTGATPTFSPLGGTYTSTQSVTISDATTGAVIHYTTDGSTPTATSAVYSAPISVSSNETLKAIAVAGGYANSAVSTASYTISSGSTTPVNYPTGFTSTSGLALVGPVALTSGALQLTDTGVAEARAVWSGSRVNVQNFTTDFNFQESSATADGLTFTIQNVGANAVGGNGGGLGYQGIGSSVAVKFDLWSNSGEGPDSTGFYTNGAVPTVPAVDMTASGVNLHSTDVLHAHISYDGTTLALTLTDTVTNASFTTSTAINIPTIVGGNTAYVGFTAGTGGAGAIQQILNWTYVVGPVIPTVASPTFSPQPGTYTNTQSVTISDATTGAVIHYTTDGTTPTAGSAVYSAPLSVSSNETLKAIALASGYANSPVAAASYTISSGSITPVNYPSGFTTTNGLSLVGAVTLTGGALQLTDTGVSEARAVWYASQVNVQNFTTDFNFTESSATADGFTFTIQNAGTSAVGSNGGGLGYQGIGTSVAVKFDLWSNSGEGSDSTGFYTNGAVPTVPAFDMSASSVNLHGTNALHAHISYDGTTLTLTLTDTVTNASFTTSTAINIPATVGGNAAYVGFTASTGGAGAIQQILNWTYVTGSTTSTAATPTFSPPAGTYSSAQSVTISDATTGAVIHYTTDGTTPTASSAVYSAPIGVSSNETLNVIAVASGYANSPVASASYIISSLSAASTPTFSPPAGTYSSAQSVTISDATTSAVIHYTTDGTTPTASSAVYSAPISVSSNETLNAIAVASGYANSPVASASYIISSLSAASTPTLSPLGGTYSSTQTVTISDATAGAVIHYTTDGSTPTATSAVYSAPISVSSNETLKAIAVASGYANSGMATASYTISSGSTTVVNYPTGFTTTTGLSLVGPVTLVSGALQLTDTGLNETRAVWYGSRLNVQNFTTDFNFQESSATADGFTFTIQNVGTNALGGNGGGLGYQGMGTSVAVKFDLWSNSGEGPDSTGFYTNGAVPTMPAVDMSASGVNLHGANVLHAHITYDGTTLTLTLTDTVTNASFTTSTAINIPAIMGSTTGYVGFTAATGGAGAIQQILNWTYVIGPVTPTVASPTFSPPAGTYTSTQSVTISDATTGAVIHYTTDGTTPTASSAVYSAPISVSSNETLKAIAMASGYANSAVAAASYAISSGAITPVNYPTGFTSTNGLALVGAVTLTGGALQLTDTGSAEARAVWYGSQVNVQNFTTDFNFTESSATADGFTFTIQNAGTSAVGSNGGGLGYQGIGTSVAVKFDLWSNSGEGSDSTGFYTNGSIPTVPAVDMSASGINLHGTNVLHAHIIYDGTTLTLTLTDTVTNASFTTSTAINIPTTVGGNAAYVGFTAGTGGAGAIQQILNWTYVTH